MDEPFQNADLQTFNISQPITIEPTFREDQIQYDFAPAIKIRDKPSLIESMKKDVESTKRKLLQRRKSDIYEAGPKLKKGPGGATSSQGLGEFLL